MDPVSAVVFAGLGIAFLWAYRADRRQKDRDAARPPVVTVNQARPGEFVRIVGTVVTGTTMPAPITGRACVCFSAEVKGVEEVTSHGETIPRTHTLAARVGANPFELEDHTGRIAVEPSGAVMRLAIDHHVTVGRGAALPLHDATLVSTQLELVEVLLTEGVVPIGAEVVVEAMVHARGANPAGAPYRAGSGKVYLAGGGNRSPSISDLPANLEDALATRT